MKDGSEDGLRIKVGFGDGDRLRRQFGRLVWLVGGGEESM